MSNVCVGRYNYCDMFNALGRILRSILFPPYFKVIAYRDKGKACSFGSTAAVVMQQTQGNIHSYKKILNCFVRFTITITINNENITNGVACPLAKTKAQVCKHKHKHAFTHTHKDYKFQIKSFIQILSNE